MVGPSKKLVCCRWLHHRVPLAHREELYHILRMTGPLLLSRILNYLLPFVVTMFCGRLGNEVMAGYGLASATINITTAATGCGLGLACDTLVAQTFGGKNLRRVGVILQRGVIILLLFCLPCWGLLINAEAILLCLGQDPEVTRIAQLYITAFLPAVPAMFLHHLQVSYLQNQGIIMPQMYTAALANIANVVTNYICLYWLDLEVSGSAAANTLSQIYICAFLFAYIWWKKLHVNTWGGWSVESLQEWGSYMKLAIPSTLMKCFEWWVYEFGGFFAGMLSEDELAAQHAVIMVALITYMFPLGIQAAACVRVGNALGAGDSARAILTSKVSLGLAGSIAIVEGLVLCSTKTVIGFIFTSDEKIVGLVSHLMNAYCFLQFFDGLVCVCTGIFLGTGKQKIPAVANLIGYYGIGLSLSVTLMFVAKLRVLGFWLGLLICVVLQSTFYIIVIFKLNWERMTEEAVNRAQKNCPVSDTAGNNTPDQTGHNENPREGSMSVRSEWRGGNTETQGGHVVLQQQTGGRLSTTQLVLRRGLTVFAAVGLLAVGATVHFLVPLTESLSLEANNTMDWINTTHTPDQISTVLIPLEETD
ncbi:putative multidrug and toxin extrusion protein 1-like [Scophthalmus maximus]|uniref:Multidrug and toxin extrusion protein n=1 Tax=Scophthalmus maximus TaxID=52904 RepID=A0A2U9B4D8_SCOMX|nr:solute carrier family 47 member 4 isoform X3 [Scophthalmus maximus]AWO98809.1 putative multidrug and toxin extrusion protein 1-like [Scophthalmus maximus]